MQSIQQDIYSDQIRELFALRPVRIPKDGNCVFRALAYATEGFVDKHEAIRELCSELCKTFRLPPDVNREDLTAKINTNGYWGGALELEMLGEHFNFNVLVLDWDKKSGN